MFLVINLYVNSLNPKSHEIITIVGHSVRFQLAIVLDCGSRRIWYLVFRFEFKSFETRAFILSRVFERELDVLKKVSFFLQNPTSNKQSRRVWIARIADKNIYKTLIGCSKPIGCWKLGGVDVVAAFHLPASNTIFGVHSNRLTLIHRIISQFFFSPE